MDTSNATTDVAPAPVPLPHWRVGDAERGAVCDQLAQHYSLGRLGADELDQRLGLASTAVRQGDLARLLDDLPPLPGAAASRPGTPSQLGELANALLLMGAVGAFCLVGLMLLLSPMLGQGVGFFSLIGGGMTVFFTAVFTRAACRAVQQRADRRQQA